jgi:Uma2 family endonuclease
LTWKFKERVELIKGWVYKMSPAPRRIHQEIESNLQGIIWNKIKNNQCRVYSSPFDVRLYKNKGKSNNEIETVVQPDICVVCDLEKLDDRGCVGAPDLIVEILSPSTIKKDYTEKFNLYEENGVKEYWIANPEGRSLQIFHLENDKYVELETYEEKEEVILSKLFRDLKIKMIDVFEY